MKFLTRFLLCLMISFSMVEMPIMKSQAHAAMISTTDAVSQMSRADSERNVSEFLNRSDVKEQMVKLGLTSEEASRRLAGLTDSELKKMSSDIDNAQVGAGVTGILVLVLLVILIIYFARRI